MMSLMSKHVHGLFKPFRQPLKQVLKQQSRGLLLFDPPKSEVLIGNNAVIFGALASIVKHGKERHPDLKIICPEYWLDNVHAGHLNEEWGQTKSGLPKVVKDILSELYPEHGDNNFITWGQMQELRKTALHLLEHNYHIPIYYGVPVIKKLENNSFDISVSDKCFNVPANTHFYFWYREPKKHGIPGVIERSITELYKYDVSELPPNLDIIVLGSGLSVYWLVKHFASSSTTRKIICIKREANQLQSNVPSNASIDVSRIVVINLEQSSISFAKDDSGLAIVKTHGRNEEYVGVFCSAIGVESPYAMIKDVPESQLTSPKNWMPSKWVSSKNIPVGSLMESIVQWFEVTNNLEWGFEPQSYHEGNNPFARLIKNNFSPAVQIDSNYFAALKNAIVSLDNPLPDKQVKPFLIQIYKEVYNPTMKQTNLFETDINRLLQQRLDLVNTDIIEQPEPEFTL